MSTVASAWRVVIGLEVHCQLATATKLFCGCRNAFGEAPNTLVCAVCSGQPGSLPVFNAEALELGLRAGLALGCTIAPRSRFDRKHYFYCDLPKGYQVSQYAQPLCSGGGIELANGKFVHLVRIHLEEDAGKALHDRGPFTLVDLNRAGVPLAEIVTAPELSSPAEAREFLDRLKELLQFAGVSECDMEKGSLRCDVNVSLHRAGEPFGAKVELKNLNSFANVVAALEHEIARQGEALDSGDPARKPVQETRLFDTASGATRPMRSKENADDYRYFPDPDLPPFTVSAERVARTRTLVPELPAARRTRYRQQFALSEYDAGVMTSSRAVSDFYEAVVKHSRAPKDAANWIGNEVLALLAEPSSSVRAIDELPFKPFDLAELIALVNEARVNRPGARTILRAMLATPKAPKELLRELGLEQVGASPELEAWCRASLAGREKALADVRAGNEKALGALIGPVMKLSGGRADPQAVREMLLRVIREP